MSALPVLSRAEDLHARLLAAHAAYRRSERDLAVLLARMADERLYLELGYASVHAYAEAELELTSRHSADLVRIGRRLPDLPAIDAAFARGDIGWTKAREIVGVATPSTEAAWLQRAVDLSSRDLERHVASAQDGEPPAEEDVLKAPSRVRIVIELDAQDAEVLQAALAVLRSGAGVSREEIDDGALIAEMARRTVHDAEPGEAPTAERYRTVLEHCPRCRHTSGVESEVNDTHVGLASCDGEVVEMRPGPKRGHLAHAIPPSMRRVVMHRDRQRCAVPLCPNRLWLDVHHVRERSRGGDHSEENLVTLCIVHHRVVHAGLLAVRAVDDGFEFEFRDGRVPRSLPRRVRSTASDASGRVRSAGIVARRARGAVIVRSLEERPLVGAKSCSG